jgi:hypothetical protein
MKLKLLIKFNYYWDALFTFIDTKQLILWYKLKTYENELKIKQKQDNNIEGEDFPNWTEVE